MIRLAIDTTGSHCSAALRRPGAADAVLSEEIGRGHAERLAPMVEALLAAHGVRPGDLDEIVVATGPGSFAGARVGVAFARGLGLACNAAVFGLTTLDAWAIEAGGSDPLACIHDARRDEAIWRLWRGEKPITDLVHGPAAEAEGRIRAAFGPGAIRTAGGGARFVSGAGFVATGIERVDPLAMLDAPAEMLGAPSPVYARPPDAKLPGGAAP